MSPKMDPPAWLVSAMGENALFHGWNASDMVEAMEPRRTRTCRCGHAKGHDMIVEEPEYTLWGWILLSMFGVTPKPDHVVYRCQICRQSVGTTRNPEVLARRSGYAANPPAVEKRKNDGT
jgi:hypothetical protein